MTPTLIGYFPKRTVQRPDWLGAAGVEEVCSASNCISDGPTGWVDRWRHNAMWVYDTPELAWSVVPESERQEFDLYAYRMFPVEFDAEGQHPFAIPAVQAQPLPPSFQRLGYDAVSRSCGNAFECSPLSCNNEAERVATNRCCLMDDAEAAFRLAAGLATDEPEPGPYYVVEVWRTLDRG